MELKTINKYLIAHISINPFLDQSQDVKNQHQINFRHELTLTKTNN